MKFIVTAFLVELRQLASDKFRVVINQLIKTGRVAERTNAIVLKTIG